MTLSTKKALILLGLCAFFVLVLIFSVSGFYNTNVEGSEYVIQIEHFSGISDRDYGTTAWRGSKPLYPTLAIPLALVFGAANALLILNILFFVGMAYCFFRLLLRLSFNTRFALIGSVWLITGYPLLKYCLSLGTDIGGLFFAVAAALLGVIGMQDNKLKFLLGSSALGFLGFISKETGILGLGFAGFYLLAHYNTSLFSWKKFFALAVPFAVLEVIFSIILTFKHIPNFFTWFFANQKGSAIADQTFRQFIFTEAASLHILFVFAALGFIFAFLSRDIVRASWLRMYIPLLLASAPVLAWPFFITRVLYIQFLFFIPISLYALLKIEEITPRSFSKPVSFILKVLPVAVSIILFLLANSRSLFEVFHV